MAAGSRSLIGDTVKLIAEAMEADVEVLADESECVRRRARSERLYASVDLAKKLFGWNPEHFGRDGFVEGLRKSVAWFRDPADFATYKTGRYNI